MGSFVNPLVFQHLLNVRPLLRVQADHSFKKVFHFLHPVLPFSLKLVRVVAGPEVSELFSGQLFEERIGRQGVLEWQLAKDQGKEHHSQSEYVCFCRVIAFLAVFGTLVNLGRHVAFFGAFELPEFEGGLVVPEVSGESEISNFERLVSILLKDQYVLQLQITMRYALTVEVANCFNHTLKGQSSGADLRLLALKVVKQTASGGVLKVEDVASLKLFSNMSTWGENVFTIFQSPNHILVVEVLKHLKFISQIPFLGGVGTYCYLEHYALLLFAVEIDL